MRPASEGDEIRSTQRFESGLRVRQLREALGLSQEDFGEAAGLHRTYVSGIERGTRNPTLTVLFRIAKGLELTLDELIKPISGK